MTWEWISSTAIAALFVFTGNWLISEQKEKKRFRVCCQLLLIEVNRHKYWINQLLSGDCFILNMLSTSDLGLTDWNHLKYESILSRMPFEEFELINEHYLNMKITKQLATKVIEDNLTRIPPKQLINKQATCQKVYDILYKYAKPALADGEIKTCSQST